MPELKNQNNDEESVTVIVSRKVKAGRENDFKVWAEGIAREASSFEGYIGTRNIQPSITNPSNHVVIIKFNHYKNLRRWEDSPVRAQWITAARDFTEGDVHIQKLTGLEYWFSLPGKPLQSPPPRFKMVIVTFLALFPTINAVNFILNPLLDNLQSTVQQAVSVLVIVTFMTYVSMPIMTRIFEFWLFKKSS